MITPAKVRLIQNFKYILLLFLIIFGGIVGFLKLNRSSLDPNYLWYVKSPDKELLCWSKNTCGWSWTQSEKFDRNLVSSSGILHEPYPKKILSRRRMMPIDSKKAYSPIDSYKIFGNYVVFIISSKDSGKLYLYDLKNNILKTLSVLPNTWVASVSPDQKYILIGNHNLNSDKNKYYSYELATGIKGQEFAADTFNWSTGNQKYSIGYLNECSPQDLISYLCPIGTNLLNCPSYPKVPTAFLQKMSNPVNFGDFYSITPPGWSFENEFTSTRNKTIGRITYEHDCSPKINELLPEDTIVYFPIGISSAKLYTPKKPLKQFPGLGHSNPVYLIAMAEFVRNSNVYRYNLTASSLDYPEYWRNDLISLLTSLVFIQDFKQ
jgi:hypothetical protein